MGLSLRGSTSGAIDINPPAVAGDNAITLPASNGSANQFFKNSGTAGIVTHSSMVENSGKIGIGTNSPTDHLQILHTNAGGLTFKTTENHFAQITADSNRTGSNNHLLAIEGHWNGTPVAEIALQTGDDTTNKDNGEIIFRTSSENNLNASERLRISPVGAFGIAGANYGSSGQVLTSQGSSSAPTWAAATSSLSFYFFGRQDATNSIDTSTYTRVTNLGDAAINQGDSSIATWDESNGTLTIGASGAGTWFLNFGAGIDDISGGFVQVVIGKNGGATSVGGVISTYKRGINDFSNYIVDSEVTTMANLSVGDVVSGYVYWSSSADSSPQPTEPNRCHFLGYKMMT